MNLNEKKRLTLANFIFTATILILTVGIVVYESIILIGSNNKYLENNVVETSEDASAAISKKVESIDVDMTDNNKVYKMPSKSINFGHSKLLNINEVDNIQIISTLKFPEGKKIESVKWMLSPMGDASYDFEQSYPNGSEKEEDKLTIKLKRLKASNTIYTLKVIITGGGLSISDFCEVNYYKEYQGFDFRLLAPVEDKVLGKSETIKYKITENYGKGTIAPKDDKDPVITYTSLLDEYTIKPEVLKQFEDIGFDFNLLYNSNDNFIGDIDVLTTVGRELMDEKLTSSSGDFKITVTKGEYSKSEVLDIKSMVEIKKEEEES